MLHPEDNIFGNLTDDRYSFLSTFYEAERIKASEEVKTCEQGIHEYNENVRRGNRFIKLIDRYVNFEELTNPMLMERIDKILVHERGVKGSSKSMQRSKSSSTLQAVIGRWISRRYQSPKN